jgi:hypothetical protein
MSESATLHLLIFWSSFLNKISLVFSAFRLPEISGLLGLGFVLHSTDAFPFSILRVTLGGLATIGLLIWQSRNNTLTQVILNYAILFFVFAFLSRVFNDNHLGYLLILLILPSFLADGNAVGELPSVIKNSSGA